MINEILVPLDMSPLAELALPHVRAIAHAFDARIHLLSVLERARPEPAAVDSVEWRLTRNEHDAYLKRTAASLREAGLAADWQTAAGAAAEQILAIAQARGVDLVALTTHGRGGLSDFRLSGTVSKVVSGAETSVLVVRPEDSATGSSPYQRILAPVDCTARGDWAVFLAARLARASGAELFLVAVVEPPSLLGSPRMWSEQTTLARRLKALNREVAAHHLDDLAARLGNGELRIRRRVVEHADAAKALHGIARGEGCALLVLSAHGHSSAAGWPYGAVTRGLLEHCDRSMLVLQDARVSAGPRAFEETTRERLLVGT